MTWSILSLNPQISTRNLNEVKPSSREHETNILSKTQPDWFEPDTILTKI